MLSKRRCKAIVRNAAKKARRKICFFWYCKFLEFHEISLPPIVISSSFRLLLLLAPALYAKLAYLSQKVVEDNIDWIDTASLIREVPKYY